MEIDPAIGLKPPPRCFKKESEVSFKVVQNLLEISVRIAFVACTVLVSAALFSSTLCPYGFISIALGAAYLSGYLFPKDRSIKPIGGPLVDPIIGIGNPRNNCAFNAVTQLLFRIEPFKKWLDIPVSNEEELRKFIKLYEREKILLNGFLKKQSYSVVLRNVAEGIKDLDKKDNIETIARALEIKEAYGELYQAYRKAQESFQRDLPSKYSSNLRRVIWEEEESQSRQRCAGEVFSRIVSVLPPPFLNYLQVKRTLEFNGAIPKEEITAFPGISVPPPSDRENPPSLQNLIEKFLQDQRNDPQEVKMESGEVIEYSSITKNSFIDLPSHLFVQVMYQKNGGEERLGGVEKILRIPMKEGEKCYKLKGFIRHIGNSWRGGHYIAGVISGNSRWKISDAEVSLVEEAKEWEDHLDKASIFLYEENPPL